MAPILVSLAVEAEFAPWRRLRRFRRRQFRDSAVYETPVGTTQLIVVLVGLGGRRADLAAALASEHRPGAGIVAGVAGALKPELKPGEVLVAEAACDPSESEIAWSDLRLVDYAEGCGAKRVQRFVTVDRIARTREAKSRLGRAAEAAEMESLTVMQRWARQGVPAVAIRAIADTADDEVPYDFEAASDSAGQVRLTSVLVQTISRIWELPSLTRFGIASWRATLSLARYLDRFVEELALEESQQRSELSVAKS
jgi:adenosylhomocysteine nucleosidase